MASSDFHDTMQTDEVPAYYRSVLGLEEANGFEDLDDVTNLEPSLQMLGASKARNFVLDFSDSASWVYLDASSSTIASLLESERPQLLSTRWVNIWCPAQQMSLLQVLAKHYDFSPRLLALMSSDPRATSLSHGSDPLKQRVRKKAWRSASANSSVEDGEDLVSEDSSIISDNSVSHTNLYKIIHDLWHYSSIDLGRNYVCIGYNSLYGAAKPHADPHDSPLPYCTRVWTWLILCEDDTIISINEDLFPLSNGQLDANQQHILYESRRNLINVFRSLSSVSTSQSAFTLLPIRARIGDSPEESANRQKDMPGLLFYYLFENWHNSYTLITRKESRYGLELNALRTDMFRTPTLAHVDRLDNIGKELGILKRHFESYDRIIDRLLEPQPASAASIQNMRLEREAEASGSRSSLDTIRPVLINVEERESTLGVSIPPPARVRFKRLRDSIDLYALREVEEYLAQKDRLININFQLIAIKESNDVDRLNKTALLLTKFTILFLPISFVTSYFSVPLTNMAYSVREYWISFAVTLFLSWVALFMFGVVSGSVQTFAVFRAIGRAGKRFGGWIVEKL